MAKHSNIDMKQQEMKKALNTRNVIIFGFLITCFVAILVNYKLTKSKLEFEPEYEHESLEELEEELLRLVNFIRNKTVLNPKQKCHFATSGGRRSYQEDRIICDINLKIPFVGRDGLEDVRIGVVAVFDGHMGSAASEMASNIFLDKFMLKLNNSIEHSSNLKELLKSSLVTTINDIDAEFSEDAFKYISYSGSTAVVALIYNNHVLVANVGDSKAFLCFQKEISHEAGATSLGGLLAKELTRDHNAHRLDERARIEASGGELTFFRNFTPLLNGHFPMTRAIGDVPLKRRLPIPEAGNLPYPRGSSNFLVSQGLGQFGIIADPEITDWLSLTSTDKFLVVSSDGIFERLTPEGVCDFLNEVDDYSDPSSLAQQLIQKAYSKGSRDNLSVVLVPLGSREPLVE